MDIFRVVNIDIEGGDKLHDRGADDPGGLTRYGFAQRYHPDLNIRTMTEADFRSAAWARYYTPLHCEEFDEPRALLLYDTAIQHGTPKAIRMMQAAAGVSADGVIGMITLRAVRDFPLHGFLLRLMEQRIRAYLSRNDHVEEVNEVGWMYRVVKITALVAAAGAQ